jgi:hypothetical protein
MSKELIAQLALPKPYWEVTESYTKEQMIEYAKAYQAAAPIDNVAEAKYYLVNVYRPNERPKLAGKPSVKSREELGGYLFWLKTDGYQFDVIALIPDTQANKEGGGL